MGSDSKTHAYEEVAKHNNINDCWLIINGKVYDVASFMEDHPGGDEVLLGAAGKDATNDFEDAGHSDTARELMEKYYVGEIGMDNVPLEEAYVVSPKRQPGPDKTGLLRRAFCVANNYFNVAKVNLLQFMRHAKSCCKK